jgi:hypothetical protein
MKPNRFLTIRLLVVVLTIGAGILLGGCASIGDKKEAGPEGKQAGAEMESPRRIDKSGTAVKETSGSSPEVRKELVANKSRSGEKPRVQEASLKADENRFKHYTAYLKQGLDRIFPKTLPDIDWNGIVTALGGIVAMSLIYGLAFGLARLPHRRRSAGPRAGGLLDRGARQKTGPPVNLGITGVDISEQDPGARSA